MSTRKLVALESVGVPVAALRWLGLLALATVGVSMLGPVAGCAVGIVAEHPVVGGGPGPDARAGVSSVSRLSGTGLPSAVSAARAAGVDVPLGDVGERLATLARGWASTPADEASENRGTAPEPPPDLALARRLYDDGLALYGADDAAGALEKFEDAFAVAPTWRMRFNLATLHGELGDRAAQREQLLAYLDEGGDEVPEDRRREVEWVLTAPP